MTLLQKSADCPHTFSPSPARLLNECVLGELRWVESPISLLIYEKQCHLDKKHSADSLPLMRTKDSPYQ